MLMLTLVSGQAQQIFFFEPLAALTLVGPSMLLIKEIALSSMPKSVADVGDHANIGDYKLVINLSQAGSASMRVPQGMTS